MSDQAEPHAPLSPPQPGHWLAAIAVINMGLAVLGTATGLAGLSVSGEPCSFTSSGLFTAGWALLGALAYLAVFRRNSTAAAGLSLVFGLASLAVFLPLSLTLAAVCAAPAEPARVRLLVVSGMVAAFVWGAASALGRWFFRLEAWANRLGGKQPHHRMQFSLGELLLLMTLIALTLGLAATVRIAVVAHLEPYGTAW